MNYLPLPIGGRRERMIGWVDSALAELAPERLVADALRAQPIEASSVVVLSLGKAAEAMMRGALSVLGSAVSASVIAGPDGGHPIPNSASFAAGQRLLNAARRAGRGDHVLALISGGGSALGEVPAPGLSTADVITAYRTLLNCGLPIDSINVVRKFISAIKGGRLASAAKPATVSSLIISDVVSGDASAVASGPTLANHSSPSDALELARLLKLPQPILEVIRSANAEVRSTPIGNYRVIANNSSLIATVAELVRGEGFNVDADPTPFVGNVAEVAMALASQLVSAQPNSLVIAGGEATIEVPAQAPPGGRLHHLVLALAETIADCAGALLAISSDGLDGGSAGRGAFLDTELAQRVIKSADLKNVLSAGAAAPLLRTHDASIAARPSGHNLADLVLFWRDELSDDDGSVRDRPLGGKFS